MFDRGYWDLNRLFQINTLGAYFIIREKGAPPFEILESEDLLEGEDNVMTDQLVRFERKSCREKYPTSIRRIVYYAEELKTAFVLSIIQIAFIYLQSILHCCISIDGT